MIKKLDEFGYKGYGVDEDGNVYGFRKQAQRCWVICDKPTKLNPTTDKLGRKVITVSLGNKKYKQVKVHHLVLLAFVGFRPTELVACHNDGNPQNNHISNLRYDTQKSNMNDTIAHGTKPDRSGENAGRAKLNWSKVNDIRKRYSDGEKIKDLALEYNVNYQTVRGIVRNKYWIRKDSCV